MYGRQFVIGVFLGNLRVGSFSRRLLRFLLVQEQNRSLVGLALIFFFLFIDRFFALENIAFICEMNCLWNFVRNRGFANRFSSLQAIGFDSASHSLLLAAGPPLLPL